MTARRAVLALAIAAIATFAAAASGVPGDGQDGVCDGRHLSRFELRLRQARAFRRSFGMPADRAYVVRSFRDRRFKPFDDGTPLSPREWRYIDDRLRVEDRASRVSDYLNRHARAISGGISIEDDYPKGAYVAVRLTRDLTVHAGPLSRLGVKVKLLLVPYTEAELNRTQHGLDFDALKGLGIEINGAYTDISRSAVIVQYISGRPDAEALIEAHYGPQVRGELVATQPYRHVCTRVAGNGAGYRVGPSGRTLRVRWPTNREYRLVAVEARETRRSVKIAVTERAPNGFVTEVLVHHRALVHLKRKLGHRRVVDAETGRRIRRLR